jgi:hypothetical protein
VASRRLTPDGRPSPTAASPRSGPDRVFAPPRLSRPVSVIACLVGFGGLSATNSGASAGNSRPLPSGASPDDVGASRPGRWSPGRELCIPTWPQATSLGRRLTSPSSRSYRAGEMVSGGVPAAGEACGLANSPGARRGWQVGAGRCIPAEATSAIVPAFAADLVTKPAGPGRPRPAGGAAAAGRAGGERQSRSPASPVRARRPALVSST